MVPGNHPSRGMTGEAPLGSPPLWAAAGAPYGGCSPGKRGLPRGNLGRTARRPLLRMSHCQRSTDRTFLFSAESVFQFSRLFRGKSPAASGPRPSVVTWAKRVHPQDKGLAGSSEPSGRGAKGWAELASARGEWTALCPHPFPGTPRGGLPNGRWSVGRKATEGRVPHLQTS